MTIDQVTATLSEKASAATSATMQQSLVSSLANYLPAFLLEPFTTAEPVLGSTALFVTAYMLSLWGLNFVVRDPTFVDAAWGMGFVLISVISAIHANFQMRSRLILLLLTMWGVRLSAYLFRRWRHHGPDPRYSRLLNKVPGNYHFATLVFVFGMQGVLMWLVSLPIQAASINPATPISAINIFGFITALAGIVFEVTADYQLVKFRMQTNNDKEKVLDTGLWRYSRHPNYFGDAVMWWGIFLLSFDSYSRLWSVIGPITMTYLLRFLSGVPLLDNKLKKTRAGYDQYIQNTSAFIPMPPSKNKPASSSGHEEQEQAESTVSAVTHKISDAIGQALKEGLGGITGNSKQSASSQQPSGISLRKDETGAAAAAASGLGEETVVTEPKISDNTDIRRRETRSTKLKG